MKIAYQLSIYILWVKQHEITLKKLRIIKVQKLMKMTVIPMMEL